MNKVEIKEKVIKAINDYKNLKEDGIRYLFYIGQEKDRKILDGDINIKNIAIILALIRRTLTEDQFNEVIELSKHL